MGATLATFRLYVKHLPEASSAQLNFHFNREQQKVVMGVTEFNFRNIQKS
jgi:hypothetical protein